MCNECCRPACPDRKACYEAVSRKNLGLPGPEHRCTAPDASEGYRFSRAMASPAFIGVGDIRDTYLTKPAYHLAVREAVYLDAELDLF